MVRSQLYPLEVNPSTGEPFLRLPAPNDNIIITPPRYEDEPLFGPIINHPEVSIWLEGPPIPYRDEDASFWINIVKPKADTLINDLREEEKRNPDGPLKLVDDCPISHLREVLPDGSDTFIGCIGVHRAQFEEVLDAEERAEKFEENNAKEAGDPTIRWTFGDYLAPSHHRRGIMSAAMKIVLDKWVVPRMGARSMTGYAFAGNRGSRRVFENSGFVWKGTLNNGKVIRGEPKLLEYLEWEYQEPSDQSTDDNLK
ncbi:hypothetical protein BJ138DRAFT_1054409 [Hygrophoropsis aurantiaca]|uniref:Uncharacterized protein n=1 Tax=Hygrophoropsis aurantiaca TaxID=72124 RepID=A0ACB8AS63_9AGAM|nr:hypothetical protein BJ138DRAFT_1054409 [Hygrophoropsis aurantiaca]